MTSENLHDTLALLLRENEPKSPALSTTAQRTIRRRVATRWTARLGALAVVGVFGTAALAGTGGGRDNTAVIASLTQDPTLGFASTTFPLTGGPEFVPASSELRCGDPAPAPHPVDHELRLTISLGKIGFGDLVVGEAPSVIRAAVGEVTTANHGAVATSGIDFLVVEDGVIKGMISGSGVNLTQNLVGGSFSVPKSRMLVDGVFCQDGQQTIRAGIDTGMYDVLAVGRVFSTPESVALSQALGDTINSIYLNSIYLAGNTGADPTAVYLPGNYGCTQARGWGSALRGCLPEITDKAVIDEAAGTVTVVYRTKDLVEEFSTVLVSVPHVVELLSGQDGALVVTFGGGTLLGPLDPIGGSGATTD